MSPPRPYPQSIGDELDRDPHHSRRTRERMKEGAGSARLTLARDRGDGSFWFGDLTQGQVLRSMRLFAEEVMPAFR